MPVSFKARRQNCFSIPPLPSCGVPAPCDLNFNLPQYNSSSLSALPPPWSSSKSTAQQKRTGRVVSFASISSRFWGSKHDACIRSTFDNIDKDRKGHITEADLQQYAAAHNLPRAYVRPFLDAILQQQQQETVSSGDDELEGEVGYDAFKEFVSSREEGLREAFSQFDLDGDGSISAEDLHISLARVSICSQPSRCVTRTRHQVVRQLLARIDIDNDRRLSFSEFRQFFMLLPQQGQLVEYWLSCPAALECADMGGHFSILERKRRKGSPWGHLLAGAVAGAASRSATAPLETLRLAAMAGTLPPGTNMLSAGRQLVSAGGVAALYKGNLVNVLRSAPARAVDFFAFDLFKAWLGSDTYAKTFAAAGLAGTLSWALLYPLEVVRSRLTLDLASQYKGLGHCVHTMALREGPGVFYRGLGPSLAAIAPEAAITYGLHDLLKRAYQRTYLKEPGVAASLCCGVVAAWSGQCVAFPLETVSRRMQLAGTPGMAAAAQPAAAGGAVAGAGGGTAARGAAAGMGQVLAHIVKEGGPGALYRGIGAATLRLVPSAIISFGAYELMRKVFLDLEAKQEMALARAQHQQLHKVLTSAQRCNQKIQQLQSLGVPEHLLGGAPGSPVCAVCDGDGEVQVKATDTSSSSNCSSSSGSGAGVCCSSSGSGSVCGGHQLGCSGTGELLPSKQLVLNGGCEVHQGLCAEQQQQQSLCGQGSVAADSRGDGSPSACSVAAAAAAVAGDEPAPPAAACTVISTGKQ